MLDIVVRLRRWSALAAKTWYGAIAVDYVVLRDAAEEIEKVRAEVERLKGVITKQVRDDRRAAWGRQLLEYVKCGVPVEKIDAQRRLFDAKTECIVREAAQAEGGEV